MDTPLKGKINIRQRLLGLVGILFSAFFILMAILLIAFEEHVSAGLAVASAMFLWIGFGFMGMLLINMKTIALDNNRLTIGMCYGLLKKSYEITEIESFKKHHFVNGFGSHPGMLIKFRDGKQVHIHQMEFKNYGDFENVLKGQIPVARDLTIEIWTMYTKAFIACGGLIVLFFIVAKILEQ